MHRLAVLAALALLAAAPVGAAPVFPGLISVEQVGAGTTVIDSEMAQCAESSPGSGIFACDGAGMSFSPEDYEWTISNWDLTLDTDPSVNSAFGFTNNSGSDQTYVITVSIPVVVFGPASLVGGSMGGSTTDASNDGAGGLSTSAPSALYEGLVDGAVALSIYDDPTSFGFIFPGQTVTIPALNPGLPGPTLPGPALTTSIGIRNTFTLSAGDSVAMTNFFEVVPVPEPSTGLLLGLGLVGVALRRQR